MIGCRMTTSTPQIKMLNTILEMSAKKKMMCIQNPYLWKHKFGLCPVIGAGLVSPRLETRWFSPPNEPRLLLVESGC